MEKDEIENILEEINTSDYDNVFTFIERVHSNIDESDYAEVEKEELRKCFKEKVLEIL